MCFKKPKADPAIAAAQEQQEADVTAKKESELASATAAREKQLEEIKKATASAADLEKQQQDKAARQGELDRAVTAPSQAKPSNAMIQRRTKRGGRGRRSLLSSSGGGQGYFSRFL